MSTTKASQSDAGPGGGKGPPELSVVVLCYRAQEAAGEFALQLSRELSTAGVDYELVLVANYVPRTDDSTPEIVRGVAHELSRCKVVAREKQGMMGWDMRSGLEAATGQNIAVIDGDGQMPSSDVIKCYRLLQASNFDMVKCFRRQRFDGAYRETISYLYNLAFRLLFPGAATFRDINAKPKVMTRRAYESLTLLSNDWFTDAEIMIEAVYNEFDVGEVSSVFYRNERRASFVPVSAIFEFLWNLLYYRLVRFGRGRDRFARKTAQR